MNEIPRNKKKERNRGVARGPQKPQRLSRSYNRLAAYENMQMTLFSSVPLLVYKSIVYKREANTIICRFDDFSVDFRNL